MNVCLHFNRFPNVLEGYCDANWVTNNDEISSTSGYVFVLGGGVISCKSSKQPCLARSTMEAELIALKLTDHESEWLRNLLDDIPLWGKSSSPVSIHCDSQATTVVANNSNYNGKKRHICMRYKVVRQFHSQKWSDCIGLCEVQKELGGSFDERISKKIN